VIVLDANVLAYLQSLGLLAGLKNVLVSIGGGHVSWDVYKQVKRSGALGDLLDEWIGERLIELHIFKTSHPEGFLVREIIRSPQAKLVGKNIADIGCVVLATTLGKKAPVVVLTCDRGLQELCKHRKVIAVDIFDVLSLLFCKKIFDASTIEVRLYLWRNVDAGNGKPQDFDGSFQSTFASRYGGEGCQRVFELFLL